jgi:hypothetical protein
MRSSADRHDPNAHDILLKGYMAMLAEEITSAQRLVRTDAYQMSIGEIVSMYDNREIIIDPEFQRLFRWDIGQKSKLIESILLGIPLPSIFVFERENGSWELIDGLQRVSTVLEFMGKLCNPNGGVEPPSILEGTKYLPSLHNAVWELSMSLPVFRSMTSMRSTKAINSQFGGQELGWKYLSGRVTIKPNSIYSRGSMQVARRRMPRSCVTALC